MKYWKFYFALFQRNRRWLRWMALWAGFCFLAGGMTYIAHPQFLQIFRDYLEKIFRDILGTGELALNWHSVELIFRNNLTVGLLILFLGIFLGLVPLFSAAVNFFILGFLFAVLLRTGFSSGLLLFASSILPHGIFEIPAFLLAAAFGLKLGLFWFRPDKELNVGQNLAVSMKESFQLLPVLAVLFFLAAVMEIFVTGNLVKFLVK